MRTFATNSQRDIYFGTDGNLVIVTDLEACLESCKRAGLVALGELPYSLSRGTPFIDIMDSKDLSLFEFYIRKMLLSVPGVTAVESVQFSVTERRIDYTAQVDTIYGSGPVTNGL